MGRFNVHPLPSAKKPCTRLLKPSFHYDDLISLIYDMDTKQNLPLLSDQLQLRRLNVADIIDFQAYRLDPEVGKYQGWQATSQEDALAFLAEMAQINLLIPGEWCQLGIVLRDEQRLIGDIGICVSPDQDEAEVGFSLASAYQGLGLAQVALQLVIQWIFQQTRAQRIKAVTDARNLSCIKLLERLGMQKTETQETMYKGEACVEFTYLLRRAMFVNK